MLSSCLISTVRFTQPHVLFNDLTQTKPIRCFDFRSPADFESHRIRQSVSLTLNAIDEIGDNLNLYLTRKCMKSTLMIFLVIESSEVPPLLLDKYFKYSTKIGECIDDDDDWSQVKSIQFVHYDLFYSIYGKCDTVFEGTSTNQNKLAGRIKEYPSEILPQFLFLGNFYDATDSAILQALGITHIVDASGEYTSRDCAKENHVAYLPMRIWDSDTTDIAVHFEKVNTFIDECHAQKGGKILIHCRAGISRSATFVLAYLLHSRLAVDLKEALSVVLDQRPYICPNDSFRAQLREYESHLLSCCSYSNDEDMMQFISSKNLMWAGIFSAETDFDRIPIGSKDRRPFKVGVFTSEYPEEGSEQAVGEVKPKRAFLKRGHGRIRKTAVSKIMTTGTTDVGTTVISGAIGTSVSANVEAKRQEIKRAAEECAAVEEEDVVENVVFEVVKEFVDKAV